MFRTEVLPIKFEDGNGISYRLNQPFELATWTYHDKPPANGGKGIRTTSVTIVLKDGRMFTGVSACSEKDQFVRTDGYNRAYGRAVQKITHGQPPDGQVNTSLERRDIDRVVALNAHQAKMAKMNEILLERTRLKSN